MSEPKRPTVTCQCGTEHDAYEPEIFRRGYYHGAPAEFGLCPLCRYEWVVIRPITNTDKEQA